jgi:hypothetical protein
MPGLAWLAAVKIMLQVGLAQLQSRRTAVDDAAQGPAMAFAKAGYGKEFSVAVSGHGPIVPASPEYVPMLSSSRLKLSG